MPRGRAGLLIVPADQVELAVFAGRPTWSKHRGSHRAGRLVRAAAAALGLTERTIRRALVRGLPLLYGARRLTRDEWEAYARARGFTPDSRGNLQDLSADRADPPAPRTGVDRQVSAVSPSRARTGKDPNLSARRRADKSLPKRRRA